MYIYIYRERERERYALYVFRSTKDIVYICILYPGIVSRFMKHDRIELIADSWMMDVFS